MGFSLPEVELPIGLGLSQRYQTQMNSECRHDIPRSEGLSLKVECDRLGLSKRVIFTHDLVPEPWSEEQLDGLYQCCEIGMSSSWGEGWGLVSFEHALRGGAQILPAHPSLREIWVDAPVWAAVGLARPIDNVSFGFAPDVSALSLAMSQLLTDPSARTRIAAACHTHASRRVFHWDEIGGQWLSRVDHLLRGAISNPKENCAVIHSAFSN